MAAFDGLGKALRWLRARQDKRQYQVAEAAGITKAMLSAYETGKQKPSLETLEKILDGLGATLGDLYQALLIIDGKSDPLHAASQAFYPSVPSSMEDGEALGVDLYRILGLSAPLPVEEEQAMRQMLIGFHNLLRYMHRGLARAQARQPEKPSPPEGDDPKEN